jgi:uncharacterized protein (DUF983 family)
MSGDAPGPAPPRPLVARERLRRAAALRCPACGKGGPFDGLLSMRPHCPACGYRFERETGYFLGSIYFNYGVTGGSAVAGYLLLDALFSLRFWQQMCLWIPWSLALPFWFHRYARSLWMAMDHGVSPPVEEDFVVRSRSAGGFDVDEDESSR